MLLWYAPMVRECSGSSSGRLREREQVFCKAAGHRLQNLKWMAWGETVQRSGEVCGLLQILIDISADMGVFARMDEVVREHVQSRPTGLHRR